MHGHLSGAASAAAAAPWDFRQLLPLSSQHPGGQQQMQQRAITAPADEPLPEEIQRMCDEFLQEDMPLMKLPAPSPPNYSDPAAIMHQQQLQLLQLQQRLEMQQLYQQQERQHMLAHMQLLVQQASAAALAAAGQPVPSALPAVPVHQPPTPEACLWSPAGALPQLPAAAAEAARLAATAAVASAAGWPGAQLLHSPGSTGMLLSGAAPMLLGSFLPGHVRQVQPLGAGPAAPLHVVGGQLSSNNGTPLRHPPAAPPCGTVETAAPGSGGTRSAGTMVDTDSDVPAAAELPAPCWPASPEGAGAAAASTPNKRRRGHKYSEAELEVIQRECPKRYNRILSTRKVKPAAAESLNMHCQSAWSRHSQTQKHTCFCMHSPHSSCIQSCSTSLTATCTCPPATCRVLRGTTRGGGRSANNRWWSPCCIRWRSPWRNP